VLRRPKHASNTPLLTIITMLGLTRHILILVAAAMSKALRSLAFGTVVTRIVV